MSNQDGSDSEIPLITSISLRKGNYCDYNIECLLDTGAQLSCMSAEFAAKAKIEHLIDRTITSTAEGIGRQQVRIHTE